MKTQKRMLEGKIPRNDDDEEEDDDIIITLTINT